MWQPTRTSYDPMPTQSHTRALALRLFDEVGREVLGESLRQRGWTFGFDRARTRLGVCRPAAKRITLSAHLSRTLPEAEVEDTVRHEIAHALDHELNPDRRGRRAHDSVWMALARRCGAAPERCFTGDVPTDPTAPRARRADPPATSTASPSAPTSAGRAHSLIARSTSASFTGRPAGSSGRAGPSAARTAARPGSKRRGPAAAPSPDAPGARSARRPAPRAVGATQAGATTTASDSATADSPVARSGPAAAA